MKEEYVEDDQERMMKIDEACQKFDSAISDESQQSGSQDEDGESDQSGHSLGRISEEQSNFTNSSGSSRSPTPKNAKKKSVGKLNQKPTSKTKSRCVDKFLRQESSQSNQQETKQEPELSLPTESMRFEIEMANAGIIPNQLENQLCKHPNIYSGSPTEATENHMKHSNFQQQSSLVNPQYGESVQSAAVNGPIMGGKPRGRKTRQSEIEQLHAMPYVNVQKDKLRPSSKNKDSPAMNEIDQKLKAAIQGGAIFQPNFLYLFSKHLRINHQKTLVLSPPSSTEKGSGRRGRGRPAGRKGRGSTVSAKQFAFDRIRCQIQLSIPTELSSGNSSSLASATKQPQQNQSQSQRSNGGARVSQEDSICMDAKTRGQRMKLKELTEPAAKGSHRVSSSFQRNSVSAQQDEGTGQPGGLVNLSFEVQLDQLFELGQGASYSNQSVRVKQGANGKGSKEKDQLPSLITSNVKIVTER